ncbi:hypothetical protein L915_00528, partial [Phytophthora nicotianae]
QWKTRDATSLKRKFRNMCAASKQTSTELASETRDVMRMMKQQRPVHSHKVPSPPSGRRAAHTVCVDAPKPTKADDCLSPFRPRYIGEQGGGHSNKQLRELFRQRKSDRRAARRHHKEVLTNIAYLKLSMESFFAGKTSLR